MTDSVTKNNEKSYDERAQQWQAAMDSNFGHKYLEKPAMVSLLPDTLHDKTVLCIGVGSGEELSELLSRGPEKVVAIDISTKLLEIAESQYPQVEFHKMDMMSLSFDEESFDYVYSSLAFHYANDWDELLAGIARVIKRGGHLLFSTHNPKYWSTKPSTGETYTNDRGVRVTEHRATLPGEVEITYFNHDSKTKITEAVEYAGFQVEKAFEPQVEDIKITQLNETDASNYDALKSKNNESPLFYVVSAEKK